MRLITLGIAALVVTLSANQACAGQFSELLDALMRGGRRAEPTGDVTPIFRQSDELPSLSIPSRTDDEVLEAFNRLDHVDDSFRRQFRNLPPREQALFVELAAAAQRIGRHGDDSIELLRKLDLDGVAQVRTYGDFVAEGVDLVGPEYKSVVRRMGDGAQPFFEQYIRPHYKKLLAAGVIAAYLKAPETFHDAAGQLTVYGFEKLTELGLDVVSAAPRGAWNAVREKFATDPVFSSIGVVLIVVFAALLVPGGRRVIWRTIRNACQRNVSDSAPADKLPRFEE